jgi:hypothetical protein
MPLYRIRYQISPKLSQVLAKKIEAYDLNKQVSNINLHLSSNSSNGLFPI